MAIEMLDRVNVLDLFAGKSEVWRRLSPDTYLGIEIEKGKNPDAIVGDNRKIIPTLDLSRFNVIDCDSYGVPATQIKLLYENKTLQTGTVILYTCISNSVSSMPKSLREYAGIKKEAYVKRPSMFNAYNVPLFYDLLASLGVRMVTEYEGHTGYGYTKKYGYFVV